MITWRRRIARPSGRIGELAMNTMVLLLGVAALAGKADAAAN